MLANITLANYFFRNSKLIVLTVTDWRHSREKLYNIKYILTCVLEKIKLHV